MSDKEEENIKTLKLKKDLENQRHKNNLEELEFIRETERKKHDWELERQRIKSAEIRKNWQLKDQSRNFR